MIYKYGNMLDNIKDDENITLITCNSTIKKDGSLVMGKGIAKQMKEKFPGIDYMFGNNIRLTISSLYSITNYLISSFKYASLNCNESFTLGAFQVKESFKDKADLELIEASTRILKTRVENSPAQIWNLNFPGIGCGCRSIEEVEPIIKILPDNVHIWRFKHEENK